uniref:Uncharacterized protein n=1 Tax=Cacopsylla melanoneura TaxID=428564 RepID=A0A8D8R2M1_9HEMI
MRITSWKQPVHTRVRLQRLLPRMTLVNNFHSWCFPSIKRLLTSVRKSVLSVSREAVHQPVRRHPHRPTIIHPHDTVFAHEATHAAPPSIVNPMTFAGTIGGSQQGRRSASSHAVIRETTRGFIHITLSFKLSVMWIA